MYLLQKSEVHCANCRFVKHIGQRIQEERANGAVAWAGCWNGGCGRPAAFGSPPGNKMSGRNRNVSDLHGGCARPYRYAARYKVEELMPDAQLVSRLLKQRRQVTSAVGKTVGKLKTVIRLNALHLDAAACIPRRQLTKKVCRRIGRLFCVGSKEPQTAELVNSSVLKQTKLGIRNAAAWNDFHIHLDALAGMGHLLVWLGFVGVFRLFSRKQPHFSHHAEQALRTACVSTLPQAVPEFDHAKRWIPAAYIADLLQFVVCVLV